MKRPSRLTAIGFACLLWAHAAFATQATVVTPSAPLPMTSLASFLNNAFLSVGSCNSGNSAPANGPSSAAFAGECWINTTANPWVFSYTADGTHWSEFGSLNTSSFVWTPFFGAPGSAGQLYVGQSAAQAAWETLTGDCSLTAGGVISCPSVHGITWPASGTQGGIPWFSSTGAISSSTLLTQFGLLYGGGSGAAPAAIVAGANDQVLMGSTGTFPAWVTINNCSNALTYNNTTHTFGCNSTAGTGNVVNSGTPVANQIAQWTGATTIQGVNLASLLTQGSGISITGTTSPTIALSLTNATLQANPANPTSSTAAVGVMMGLGSACHLTPSYSGRVKIEFIGDAHTSTTTATIKVNFGTGTAPTNGASPTGTQVGNSVTVGSSTDTPFANGGIITGLSPGTAYWFDIDLLSSTGGIASTVDSLSCNALEF